MHSASGGFVPNPLTRGSALDPAGGSASDPVIGSRSALAMSLPTIAKKFTPIMIKMGHLTYKLLPTSLPYLAP